MKHLIIMALLSVMTLNAQKQVEIKAPISKGQEVFVNFKFAQDIKIQHGNTNEIIVRATVNIDDGEGNDKYSIKTEKSSSQLKLYSDFGDYFKNRSRNVYYSNKDGKKENCNCCHNTDINYIVIVPRNIKLKIKSISGSVFTNVYDGDLVTDLISGDVTIKKYNGELRLKTISGVLDIVVNKAKLNAKSVTGTIYSDMDFDKSDFSKYNNKKIHNHISKQVNGGTLLLTMETVSGNIYIRKG
ncbi:DUF4097 family beta strand repeat-containing protein [Seonamhaeicola marinus]|uniref:DUF4097 domain-containing protein n=1 Tax=Seonamhaeicola marinus TaxID=1912246 RepID=A0A5D0HU38_9FLAO|nr:hypothetical protein [Seonamhaeicola marinus]TYA74825.1 hypothetical protein FUA24_16085 [Seonamhaeicola marinus]